MVFAFDNNEFPFAKRRSAFHEPRSGCAEHHATRRRHRFHPLRHSDMLSDRGVTYSARTDFTGDHLTEVQSDAQLHTVDLLLNVQRRQTCASRVVFQGHRRAEDRHDAVTGELVDRAAVALHHRACTVHEVGHDLAQPFCADVFGDVHRVNDIGEKHRHLLVLRRLAGLSQRRSALATELGCRGHFHATRPAPRVVHANIVTSRFG